MNTGTVKIFQWIAKFDLSSKTWAHFMPIVSSYIPWKYQKTSSCLMFSRGDTSGMKLVKESDCRPLMQRLCKQFFNYLIFFQLHTWLSQTFFFFSSSQLRKPFDAPFLKLTETYNYSWRNIYCFACIFLKKINRDKKILDRFLNVPKNVGSLSYWLLLLQG